MSGLIFPSLSLSVSLIAAWDGFPAVLITSNWLQLSGQPHLSPGDDGPGGNRGDLIRPRSCSCCLWSDPPCTSPRQCSAMKRFGHLSNLGCSRKNKCFSSRYLDNNFRNMHTKITVFPCRFLDTDFLQLPDSADLCCSIL